MKCPVSVLLIAIFGLMWAAMRALSYFSLIGMMVFVWFSTGPLPPTMAIYHNTLFVTFSVVLSVVSLALTVLLVVGCFGSIRMRPWAPRPMLIYAVADIVLLLVSTVINVVYVLPMTVAAMPPSPGLPAGFMKIIMLASAIVGVLIGLILPVAILIVYTRTKIRNAFAAGGRMELAGFPVQGDTGG